MHDKGYYSGNVDGLMGVETRAALREYQKAEELEVTTGRLDPETAGKLGVGPESVGGSFKGAGKEVKEGSEEAVHEMKEGKPVAAGKEMGKGIGREQQNSLKSQTIVRTGEMDEMSLSSLSSHQLSNSEQKTVTTARAHFHENGILGLSYIPANRAEGSFLAHAAQSADLGKLR